jgi:hypothetical protein
MAAENLSLTPIERNGDRILGTLQRQGIDRNIAASLLAAFISPILFQLANL